MPRRSTQLVATTDAYEALGGQAHYLDIIRELAIEILRGYSVDELLWLVARNTIARLGFEDCVIYLLDEERRVLVQRAAFGPKSPEGETIVNPIEIALGEGIVGTVARTLEPELVVDVRDDPRYIVDDQPRRSELAVPIVHDGRVIGVIDSEHSQPGFYTDEHRAMMIIIASMASSRLAAALTIEQLNETVAELEQARNALRREERRYRDLYNQHPSMFFSVDAGGRILSTNDYACQELGRARERIERQPLCEVVRPAGDAGNVTAHIAACIASPAGIRRWEGSIVHADGKQRWLRLTARALAAPPSAPTSVLIVAEDVTEARDLSLELEFSATHDWLTGLYNRRAFEHHLEAAMQEGDARGVEHVLCFIDLDQFKVVNDTCGHAAGDALLRHVAHCFEEHVRRSDIVGRIGGDEFAVLMRECSIADAKRSAHALVEVISEAPFHWDGHTFSVGASVGICALGNGGGVDDAFSAADAACLSAKEHGRNRVHVYRERDEDLARRKGESRWIYRITRALSEDAFDLHYQPLEGLADGDAGEMHAEILVRMRDQDGALVLPDAFIPAAERYGLAVRLDTWVVARALAWIGGAGAEAAPRTTWSVNLSGATVGDHEFLEFLVDHLAASRVSPESLCFEITETAAIADLVRARRFIERLKDLGCRFALDDFGIGLSSLAYLKSFPVDFLKIDGVFIKDINIDPVSAAMVRSINDIGHLTGKKTVAEYVHDAAVLDVVRAMGVDFAQGNAIAKPRPLAEWAPRMR